MKKHTAYLLIALLAFCSCRDDRLVSSFVLEDGVVLMENSNTVFMYDPGTCQMSFNRDRCEFRVHTDNMSDFFTLTLSEIPERQGQDVKGTLVWTTRDDIYTKRNVTFTAEKLEGDKLWLWTGNGRMGVVVRVLD